MHTGRSLATFYIAFFAAFGILVPFWPLWLAGRGFDEGEVADIVSASIWVRALAAPFWGHRSDRRAAHRATIRGLTIAAVATCALWIAPLGYWGTIAVTVLFAATFSPVLPLLDSTTIRACRADGSLDYGRIRLWGSVAFLVVTTVAGLFLEGRSREWILGLLLGGLVLTAACTAVLPKQAAGAPGGARPPLSGLLADRSFLLLLLTCACMQGSHATYYALSTIHWEAAGISRGWIGFLWSEGVIAEVCLFAVAGRAVPWRPAVLLLLAAAAGCVRWGVLAQTTSVPALAAVQWLHAFTFGATHLAAVRWVGRHVAPGQTATAQTLLAAISVGVGLGVTTPIAGRLYEAYGGGAFWLMVVFAGCGACGACLLLLRTGRGSDRG